MTHVEEHRMKEYNEAFSQIDKDGDNTVSRNELFTIFRILGEYPTDEELQEMIQQVDPNDTGIIERDIFLSLMEKTEIINSNKKKLEETFRILDKNNEGNIVLSEIISTMKNLGEEISEKDAKDMLDELDTNKDGMISLEEFMRLMKQK